MSAKEACAYCNESGNLLDIKCCLNDHFFHKFCLDNQCDVNQWGQCFICANRITPNEPRPKLLSGRAAINKYLQVSNDDTISEYIVPFQQSCSLLLYYHSCPVHVFNNMWIESSIVNGIRCVSLRHLFLMHFCMLLHSYENFVCMHNILRTLAKIDPKCSHLSIEYTNDIVFAYFHSRGKHKQVNPTITHQSILSFMPRTLFMTQLPEEALDIPKRELVAAYINHYLALMHYIHYEDPDPKSSYYYALAQYFSQMNPIEAIEYLLKHSSDEIAYEQVVLPYQDVITKMKEVPKRIYKSRDLDFRLKITAYLPVNTHNLELYSLELGSGAVELECHKDPLQKDNNMMEMYSALCYKQKLVYNPYSNIFAIIDSDEKVLECGVLVFDNCSTGWIETSRYSGEFCYSRRIHGRLSLPNEFAIIEYFFKRQPVCRTNHQTSNPSSTHIIDLHRRYTEDLQ